MTKAFLILFAFLFTLPLLSAERPNVLMILVDDLRPELGCYGAEHMVTPHMDAFATESIRFERAYTQQAVCLPSRISLFSGQYPQTTGVTTLQDKYWKLHDDPLTLTRYLHQNGYFTAGMGKVYHDEQVRRWDDWTEVAEHSAVIKSKYAGPDSEALLKKLQAEAKSQNLTGKAYRRHVLLGPTEQNFGADERYHDFAMTDLAIEKLDQLKSQEQPFFLNVGYRKPHLPFVAPKRFWDLYDRDQIQLTDNPEPPAGAPPIALMTWGELRAYKGVPQKGPVREALARELIHGYYACVSYVDAQIGRLMQALKEKGLAENTIVVLWGDHGWKLGDHGMWCKHTNYEIDTKIPLFIRLPDGRQAGSVAMEYAESIDIYPTICDYLGLSVPEQVEGKSLTYLFDDASIVQKEAAYSEYQRHGNVTGFSIKSGQFRYTEWIHLPTGDIRARELYDHKTDPREDWNLEMNPQYSRALSELSEILKKGPAGRYTKSS